MILAGARVPATHSKEQVMNTMNRYRLSALCLMLLLIGTAADAKIIFGSQQGGEIGKPSGGVRGIYVMDDDGSNLTLLIQDNLIKHNWLKPVSPRWSPNGKHIVFAKFPRIYHAPALFLMNADGTNIRQLTETHKMDPILGASFSPDSTSIVFSRDAVVNKKLKSTITVMDLATTEMKIIADVYAVNCEWSPDGKHIVFDKPSAVGGNGGTIWIMRADGHNIRPLIPAHPPDKTFTHRLKPRWSPDGKQIAFLQREYTWHRALTYHAHRYIICDHNGDNVRKLRIPKDFFAASLDWMDNGKSIVFTARAGMPLGEPVQPDFIWPPSYVYKYNLRTGEITQLTNDPGWDQIIDWIPDDVLPVTPKGKKLLSWGELKK